MLASRQTCSAGGQDEADYLSVRPTQSGSINSSEAMNKEITPRCGVFLHRLSEGSVEEGVVAGSGGVPVVVLLVNSLSGSQ